MLFATFCLVHDVRMVIWTQLRNFYHIKRLFLLEMHGAEGDFCPVIAVRFVSLTAGLDR